MSDYDFLNEADAIAPDSTFTNYGKLTWKVNCYIVWKDSKPVKVEPEQYGKAPTKVTGADGKSKTGKSIELLIAVNIQEFKPNLTFNYERKINVGDWDWNATFKPSLEKVLGVKVAKGVPAEKEIDVAEAMKRIQGQYVAYQDVPQKKEAKDGKTYRTIKLVKLFKSRAECEAAMGDTVSTASNGAEPNAASDVDLSEVKRMKGKGKSAVEIAVIISGVEGPEDLDKDFLEKIKGLYEQAQAGSAA